MRTENQQIFNPLETMGDPSDVKKTALRVAENAVLRPSGAFSRPFTYGGFDLSGTDVFEKIETVYNQYGTPGFHGMFYLCDPAQPRLGGLFMIANFEERKILGFFATGTLAGEGTLPAKVNFVPYHVLSYFDLRAQWNAERVGDSWYLGNGVDPNRLLWFGKRTPAETWDFHHSGVTTADADYKPQIDLLSQSDENCPGQPLLEKVYRIIAMPPSGHISLTVAPTGAGYPTETSGTWNVTFVGNPIVPKVTSLLIFEGAGNYAGAENNGMLRVWLNIELVTVPEGAMHQDVYLSRFGTRTTVFTDGNAAYFPTGNAASGAAFPTDFAGETYAVYAKMAVFSMGNNHPTGAVDYIPNTGWVKAISTIGDLASFISTDPKLGGRINCRVSGPSDAGLWDIAQNKQNAIVLTGGVGDALDPRGFSNTRISVLASYCKGANHEDEGIESAPSPAASTEFYGDSNDLYLTLRSNADTALKWSDIPAPYDTVKLYLQIGTMMAAESKYRLVNYFTRPGGVASGAQVEAYGISPVRLAKLLADYGTEFTEDKFAIAPVKYFSYAGGRWFFAGNSDAPRRVWLTAPRPADKPARTVFLKDFLTLPAKEGMAEEGVVRACYNANARIHYHVGSSIAILDPGMLRVASSTVTACAMNSRSIAEADDGHVVFLGTDGLLYRVSRTTGQAADTKSAARPALTAIREAIGADGLALCPQLANSHVDMLNRVAWFFAPKTTSSVAIFGYDLDNGGIFGPLDAPVAFWHSTLGMADPRLVHIGADGHILSTDFSLIAHTGNAFDPSEPFELLEGTEGTSGTQLSLGSLMSLSPLPLRNGRKMVVETPFLRFGNGENFRLGVFAVRFSTKPNSRGLVRVTVESDNGMKAAVDYGDVYGRDRHKAAFLVSGQMFRIRFEIIVGEDKSFTLTEVAVDYEIQGKL